MADDNGTSNGAAAGAQSFVINEMARAALIQIYGPSGKGKTAEATSTFPRAVHVCRPGAAIWPSTEFLSLRASEGVEPIRVLYANDLRQIPAAIKIAKSENRGAIVIDDITLMGEDTERALRGIMGTQGGAVFAKYASLDDFGAEIRKQARFAGCHVCVTGHDRGPGINAKGKAHKGNISLPSMGSSERFPHEFDITVRLVEDPTRMGDWKTAYWGPGASEDWFAKDRLNAVPSICPANMRAILYSKKIMVPRARGLEWQDADMTLLAVELNKCPVEDLDARLLAVSNAMDKMTREKRHEDHINWVVRDSLAYEEIRRLQRAKYSAARFFSASGPAAISGSANVTGGVTF